MEDGRLSLLKRDDNDKFQVTEYSVISQEEFEARVILCRINLSLDLLCGSHIVIEESVQRCSSQLKHSGGAAFLLKDSELVLGKDGIISLGECVDENQDARSLLSVKLPSVASYNQVSTLVFDILVNKSTNSSRLAPVIEITSKTVSPMKGIIGGECFAYVPNSLPVKKIGELLLETVLRQLELSKYWLHKLESNLQESLYETFPVLPYKSGHIFSLLYPKDVPETELSDYRKQVNQTFMLPLNCPFMSKLNKFEFTSDKQAYHLYNTHIGLKDPTVSGSTRITKGIYSYHHYMQDKFNDNKWGCAYRSLQTIISWFIHQGYTTKHVPTHREIQQCLVTIGDKPTRFVGSTEWIGSTEVGFVLESYLGVTSRFISVASGDELGEKGRELVHHFSTQGTPIMIGGGVLAHTILGVTWNSSTGDISYLILDPHYTGSEDINTIQRQGWCGWKGSKFWNAKAYYNLCLPQRPSVV